MNQGAGPIGTHKCNPKVSITFDRTPQKVTEGSLGLFLGWTLECEHGKEKE